MVLLSYALLIVTYQTHYLVSLPNDQQGDDWGHSTLVHPSQSL